MTIKLTFPYAIKLISLNEIEIKVPIKLFPALSELQAAEFYIKFGQSIGQTMIDDIEREIARKIIIAGIR